MLQHAFTFKPCNLQLNLDLYYECERFIKVKVGNDQEMGLSERNSPDWKN